MSYIGFRRLLICIALIGSQALAQNCAQFGTYTSSPEISYTCAFGLVAYSYSAWVFTDLGSGNIRVTGSPSGSIPVLAGTLDCGDSTFTASITIVGSCTETYTLLGKFNSDTSWYGTFRAQFTGTGCLDCVTHTDPVSGTTNRVTGVAEDAVPVEAHLAQNYPNPFNPSTNIQFFVTGSGLVSLKVANIFGQEIATLVEKELMPGSYSLLFDAVGIPSGVYFYRLQAGGYVSTKKLMLLR